MEFDFVVYRATPAGIMAAISAQRLGLRSVIIEPTAYIGGMMTSGLNATDTINVALINGTAREFFLKVQDHYKTPYLPIRFESKVATRIFTDLLKKAGVEVIRGVDVKSAERNASDILGAELSDGTRIKGRWWVDASYEGDLMAKAHVACTYGRESKDTYGEEWAGFQPAKPFIPGTKGRKLVSPEVNGNLRPYLEEAYWGKVGASDDCVQAYCIRPTLTNERENRVKIRKPDFDFSKFDLFREFSPSSDKAAVRSVYNRNLGITYKSGYFNLAQIPNGKFDMNSGPFAPINSPSLTQGWIEADMPKRAAMRDEFARYTQAVLYFIQHDLSVPAPVRSFFAHFGLPADEYETTDHMPQHVYVREGRRLIGEKVFTQNDVASGGASEQNSICHARYNLDCKPVHWRANKAGKNVVREGMFFSQEAYKYGLPPTVITPKRGDTRNFFSVCGVSASHVAFGSIRMEPTWMELGTCAAIMAHLSEKMGRHPIDIPASEIRTIRDLHFDPTRV